MTNDDIARLHQIGIEKKRLEREAKEIKDRYISYGVGRYESAEHSVLVSECNTVRIDWKAVAEKLNPSHQLVSAHTKTSKSYRVTTSQI